VLVLLPPLAGLLKGQTGTDWGTLGLPLAIIVGKIVAFVAVMLVVGHRAIPLLLHYVAHTGSRELFRLAVLA
jgi:CPA2 family monovalent cation:H+ antiporter-2